MTAIMTQRRILVIDDDPEVLRVYGLVLGKAEEAPGSATEMMTRLLGDKTVKSEEPSFSLSFARQGEEGYRMATTALERGEPFSLAFVDVRMPPGWDGMETAARLRQDDPDLELVIVTAYSDRSREEIVRAVGSSVKLLFFRKPFDPEELKQLALSLTDKWLLARQAAQQRRELLASEQRFRALVETTGDWVWEVDRDGRFIYCSPVCLELYGRTPEELLGKDIFKAFAEPASLEPFRQIFLAAIASASRYQAVERRCLTKDGRLVIVESSGTPVLDPSGQVTGFRGIDRDITLRKQGEEERRKLEEQYRQSQKLEALGTLAGGIAHDLNNILTPILGYSELGQMKTGPNHPLREYFDSIAGCGRRAADLVRRILAFCRKQDMVVERVDLNKLLNEFTKMLSRLIREDISLVLSLDEALWPVMADQTQMEQILVNLVVNARDAMEGSGGELLISTANRSVTSHTLYDIEAREIEGDFVELSVCDQGGGIEPEKIRMIFDPFFTTKETGKGTGLGLATVHGIVAQHGGYLAVQSELGQGSRFSIFLPRNDQGVEGVVEVPIAVAMPRGTGTILLVEDDTAVLHILAETLKDAGYTILKATNGREGLALFEEQRNRIDLLATDLIMPVMGGKALAEIIREQSPDFPVLYMSGYSFETSSQELIRSQNNTMMLQKPFSLPLFTKTVQELLAKRGPQEKGAGLAAPETVAQEKASS